MRDKTGEVLKSVPKSDILDLPYSDNMSVATDTRYKVLSLSSGSFPYVIEYELVMETKNLMSVHSWSPNYYGLATRLARLKVTYPDVNPVSYRELNIDDSLTNTMHRENQLLWTMRKVPEIENPKYLSPDENKKPEIRLAPEKFVVDNYKGSFSSWEKFGNWYYQLNQGRQQLPLAAQKQVNDLLSKDMDRKEKIYTLYRHLQDENRYISVQLGIGGWRTFDAKYVHEKKYGDCKALTNYMQSMLNFIGVDAYPALINSGVYSNMVREDFPQNVFNHVVLYVPGEEDIWLECTSKSLEPSYLGLGNSGKKVLITKPQGSYLKSTPEVNLDQHYRHISGSVQLLNNKTGVYKLNEKVGGEYKSIFESTLVNKTSKEQEEWIQNQYDVPNMNLTKIDVEALREKKTNSNFSIDFSVSKLASETGSRLFVPANPINMWRFDFGDVEEREEDIYLSAPVNHSIELSLKIPEGYEVEFLPESQKGEDELFSYEIGYEQKDDEVMIRRKLELHQRKFPYSRLSQIKETMNDIIKAGRKQIILKAI
jgi:hypothetical protein